MAEPPLPLWNRHTLIWFKLVLFPVSLYVKNPWKLGVICSCRGLGLTSDFAKSRFQLTQGWRRGLAETELLCIGCADVPLLLPWA